MFGCYNHSMQRNPQPEEFADRRAAPRAEVEGRYSTQLDPCDGRDPIVCSLVDFSVTGVRLELPEDVPLPEKIHIVIGKLSHNCRIVWRKGSMIGVDFVDEHHSLF